MESGRFAGMTKEQILGIVEGQAVVLDKFNQPQPVVEQPRNRFDFDIADDQYVDGRQVKQILAQFAAQGPPADNLARQQAAGALLAAVQMRRSDEFKRWGPEIQAELSKLSPDFWTLDNLNVVVDIVKSRHIDDLAAEKAQRIINESHPTIRSGTGGSAGVSHVGQRTLADENLPKGWVDRARALGIDEAVVKEFSAMQGISPDDYLADVERYGKGAIVRG